MLEYQMVTYYCKTKALWSIFAKMESRCLLFIKRSNL